MFLSREAQVSSITDGANSDAAQVRPSLGAITTKETLITVVVMASRIAIRAAGAARITTIEILIMIATVFLPLRTTTEIGERIVGLRGQPQALDPAPSADLVRADPSAVPLHVDSQALVEAASQEAACAEEAACPGEAECEAAACAGAAVDDIGNGQQSSNMSHESTLKKTRGTEIGSMLHMRESFERFHLGKLASFAALVIFTAGFFKPAPAQQPRQRTFNDCGEASAALFAAAQKGDQSALLEILGPAATEIISTGDEAEDRSNRQQFVEKYQEMHRLVRESDGTTTLYIGAENWPTPIPLVHKGNRWYFDTIAGRKEILLRRIGNNELETVAVCRELVAAQNEYHAQPHDGDAVKQYAPRFRSEDGKHDGLYWKISAGEPESPVGPLLTLASGDEYARETTRPLPFHGYYYRILTSQGRHAPGGPKSYIFNGKMTRGFAFVAYPAEYRSSGVMTFIVNQDGIIYQKDLGPRTGVRAKAMTQYAPDSTWKKVD